MTIQLIQLPLFWTISLDIGIWFLIHWGVSRGFDAIHYKYFPLDHWLYRERQWEKQGQFYERFLFIKSWKDSLPDGAVIFKTSFPKKRLESKEPEYINRFVHETCRAEIIHWVIFLMGPLFYFWNSPLGGHCILAYAFVMNVPCGITQRYNRIRLSRLFHSYLD